MQLQAALAACTVFLAVLRHMPEDHEFVMVPQDYGELIDNLIEYR